MGGLFIAVVVLFPNGLAGIWDLLKKNVPRLVARLKAGQPLLAPGTAIAGKGEKS